MTIEPDPAGMLGQAHHAAEAESLEQLWRDRTDVGGLTDVPIGPGDILQINVPGIDEFKDYKAKVTPTGTLELPLVGNVQAAGRTEEGLARELKLRLGEYARTPDVEVLPVQYASREVAVVGLVRKPGLYTLSSSSETLQAVMTEAGGLTETAASQIYFIPAQKTLPLTPATSSIASRKSRSADAMAGRADAIVIDLARPESSKYMALPARPGDVIIASAAGAVLVQGWVRNPGSFPIIPRMTVLGAVDAAGGAMFSSTAHLLRETGTGGKSDLPLDLSKIAYGGAPDIPVESGDVVVVSGSAVGAIPYVFLSIMSKFNAGVYSGL
jgi:polysaccharide export outer membrane protein